jgi:hypothetical protein
MIITAEYLRTNYTGAAASTDAVATECLRAAIGEIEHMIGQPVQLRQVEWSFTGNGQQKIIFPYTLKVDADALTVEYRPSLDADWEAVDDIEYRRPAIHCVNGFFLGGEYRATTNVGLADVVSPALLSADFNSGFQYEALRAVICELAEVKFYASPSTNAGVKRSGLKSVSETEGPGATKTQVFVEGSAFHADWKRRLKPFMRIRLR